MSEETLPTGPVDDAGDEWPELPPEGRTLAPADVCFRREEARLQMREGEGAWREVSVVRLFPLSDPGGWLAVVDDKQADIGLLSDLEGYEPDQRALIEDELRRRYLTPVITAITAIRHRGDVAEWTVETDRGETSIVVRNVREKVKEPLPEHLTIEDARGNRYEIPDRTALDAASRRLLDREV